jgi:hypothetical protein
MGDMYRTKLNPGLAPTVSSPAATWGVCQKDEIAIFVGSTPTGRLKGSAIVEQLRSLARDACQRPGAPPGVPASGTISLLNVGKKARGVAGLLGVQANDTFTLGDLTLTFVAADPGENQVLLGADDNAAAQNVADIINGVPVLSAQFLATVIPSQDPGAIAAQLVIEGKVRGDAQNAVALQQTGNHITVSGATLAGGTEGDGLTIDIGDATLEFGAALPLENAVTIGDTDDETAVNLAAAINAHSVASPLVVATVTPSPDPGVEAAVVTVTAHARDDSGNAIGLATDAAAAVAVSGANLAGGTVKVGASRAVPGATLPTVGALAGATGVTETNVAVVWGDSVHASLESSGRFLAAVEHLLKYFLENVSRKA